MKKIDKKLKMVIFPCSVILGILFILFLFHKQVFDGNVYNSYTKQCVAWLDGRLDLGQNYEWLELAVFNNKYYVSFPPFPSYILLPFVAIFGEGFNENLISILCTIVGITYSMLLADKYKVNKTYITAIPILLYGSSAVLQIIINSWVWFLAQNLALTFTIMSFYYAKQKQKGLSLFLLCCASGCRPFQVLYFPLIVYLYYENDDEKFDFIKLKNYFLDKIYVFIPTVILSISYLALNYARFGSIFEFGHNYLPEFTSSDHGQFNPIYILSNAVNLFRLPGFTLAERLIIPEFNGMNIFICFPIIILYVYLVAKSKVNVKTTIVISTLIVLHIIMLLSHKTMGGYHYGNRYIIDTMPAFLIGIVSLNSKNLNFKKTDFYVLYVLIALGFMFNFLSFSKFLS